MKTSSNCTSSYHNTNPNAPAIEAMIARGKRPTDVFTARTIEIPDPSEYSARDVRELRESLHVTQAIFARLLGV
jgi:DNA-binding transcriptional regulator YiaG